MATTVAGARGAAAAPADAEFRAAEPTLPTSTQIAEVVAAAMTTSTELSAELAGDVASAKSCTLDATRGDLRCDEVRAPGHCAASWQPGLALKAFVASTHDGSTWWVGELVVTDVGIVMTDVVWRSPSGEVVKASGAMGAGEELTLKEPRWFAASAPIAETCPSPPETRSVVARAAGAHFDGVRWRHDGLRVGPWPLGEPQRPHVGASGFLPPTVRTDGVTVGAQGYYWLAPFTALTAFGDLSGRVGGGATLITARRETLRPLDLAAVYDVETRALRPLVEEDPRRATAMAEGALIRLKCGERCFDHYRKMLWS